MDDQTKTPRGFINAPITAEQPQKSDFSLDPPGGLPSRGAPPPQSVEAFQQLDEARQEAVQKQKQQEEDDKDAPKEEVKTKLQTEVEAPELDFDVFGLDPERRKLLASLIGPEQKALAAEFAGPIEMMHLKDFGEFQQWVVIAQTRGKDPGMEVKFRTMSSEEDVMVQEFVQKYENLPLLTFQTIQQLCILACCVIEVRGLFNEQYKSHLVNKEVDEKRFLTKLKMIKGLPVQAAAMIGTHCAWFDERVRERFMLRKVEEDVKNG